MGCPLCDGTMNLGDPFDTAMMHMYQKRMLVHLSHYDPNTRMAIRRAQQRARDDPNFSRFDYVWPGDVVTWLKAEWYERMSNGL